MAGSSFFAELRKRKVIQSAAIYFAIAWGVVEATVTVVEHLFLPQWVSTVSVIAFVMGFPVAMFLAWTFDLTPEGLERTVVSSRRGRATIGGALLLLLAGTAGLFFLIWPGLESQVERTSPVSVLPNSIAVLPFENTGSDPADAYLGDGLSDELRDQLGQVPGLRVAARSSSVAARQQGLAAQAASEKLGVASLVEGSMRRQGSRLRISVQLIEGRTGLALWSQTFERSHAELVNVQQEIVRALAGRVLPESDHELGRPATRDASAHEKMLLARYYEQQVRNRETVDENLLVQAVDLYRQASEADPESALAHARLGAALLYLGDLDGAEAPIFRALALAPGLSEVQNTVGLYYWARGLPEAGPAFERAVTLNSNNVDALHNYAEWHWFQYDRGGLPELLERAVALDPLSLARHAAIGEYYGKEGRVDKVQAIIRKVLDLFEGVEVYRLVGRLQELIGNVDEAIAWTLRARDAEPDNPDHRGRLAELYAILGDFETTLALEPEPSLGLLFLMRRYQQLIDLAELQMIEYPDDISVRYLLAFAYHAAGNHPAAIRILSTTGQPDIVLNNTTRTVSDHLAFFTLIDALAAAGEKETARMLALAVDGFHPGYNTSWWYHFHIGCMAANLGRTEASLDRFALIKKSPELPWESLVRDSYCVQQFADNPVYQDVLRHLEERKAALRERLPATLAANNVVP
jgi:TolB-like protein/tetratricopeptide (TPR) repeat protein